MHVFLHVVQAVRSSQAQPSHAMPRNNKKIEPQLRLPGCFLISTLKHSSMNQEASGEHLLWWRARQWAQVGDRLHKFANHTLCVWASHGCKHAHAVENFDAHILAIHACMQYTQPVNTCKQSTSTQHTVKTQSPVKPSQNTFSTPIRNPCPTSSYPGQRFCCKQRCTCRVLGICSHHWTAGC